MRLLKFTILLFMKILHFSKSTHCKKEKDKEQTFLDLNTNLLSNISTSLEHYASVDNNSEYVKTTNLNDIKNCLSDESVEANKKFFIDEARMVAYTTTSKEVSSSIEVEKVDMNQKNKETVFTSSEINESLPQNELTKKYVFVNKSSQQLKDLLFEKENLNINFLDVFLNVKNYIEKNNENLNGSIANSINTLNDYLSHENYFHCIDRNIIEYESFQKCFEDDFDYLYANITSEIFSFDQELFIVYVILNHLNHYVCVVLEKNFRNDFLYDTFANLCVKTVFEKIQKEIKNVDMIFNSGQYENKFNPPEFFKSFTYYENLGIRKELLYNEKIPVMYVMDLIMINYYAYRLRTYNMLIAFNEKFKIYESCINHKLFFTKIRMQIDLNFVIFTLEKMQSFFVGTQIRNLEKIFYEEELKEIRNNNNSLEKEIKTIIFLSKEIEVYLSLKENLLLLHNLTEYQYLNDKTKEVFNKLNSIYIKIVDLKLLVEKCNLAMFLKSDLPSVPIFKDLSSYKIILDLIDLQDLNNSPFLSSKAVETTILLKLHYFVVKSKNKIEFVKNRLDFFMKRLNSLKDYGNKFDSSSLKLESYDYNAAFTNEYYQFTLHTSAFISYIKDSKKYIRNSTEFVHEKTQKSFEKNEKLLKYKEMYDLLIECIDDHICYILSYMLEISKKARLVHKDDVLSIYVNFINFANMYIFVYSNIFFDVPYFSEIVYNKTEFLDKYMIEVLNSNQKIKSVESRKFEYLQKIYITFFICIYQNDPIYD